MGIVTQDTILFNDSIYNNICYGKPDATMKQIQQAAKTANALEFIENLPKGFQTTIGEKGTLLSGGQKQRISISRAILKNPEILIQTTVTSQLGIQNYYSSFSKNQEKEADLFAIDRLNLLEISSKDLREFLEFLERKSFQKGISLESF